MTDNGAGSTNYEEDVEHKYEYDTDNEEETQQAQRPRGMKAPQQPTRQERFEHELTHLPYRSWCPICVKSKGRTDNHPKQTSRQPVIQVDFTYMKAFGDKQVLPVLNSNRCRIRYGNGSPCTRTRTNNNNTWYDVYKHSCLNVDEHKQHSHQQHYKQTKRISY